MRSRNKKKEKKEKKSEGKKGGRKEIRQNRCYFESILGG